MSVAGIQVVSEVETQALATQLIDELSALQQWPAVVYLRGDLGAGKSVFARAMLNALGVNGRIKSPTYTLVELYPLDDGFQAAHLDLYRLNDPDELYYIAFDDIVNSSDLMLIEWPEKGFGQLPKATHEVIIEYSQGAREIQILRQG